MSAKININSNMTFESKMNLKNIPVCSKSIKITAILSHFFKRVAILMNFTQLLIFFCQKIQFRSHKSRSFNGNHFSNMWVCFDFWIHTFMCNFYTNLHVFFTQICMYFLHKCVCNFTKHQLSFLQICDCYFYFPFIVN